MRYDAKQYNAIQHEMTIAVRGWNPLSEFYVLILLALTETATFHEMMTSD